MTYPGIENDTQALSVNPDLAAVEARRAEREKEYGQYVAVGPIPWGTVLAFNPGDPVPVSTVERLKWDELGLVAKRSSKEGRKVLEDSGQLRPEEAEPRAAAKSDEADKTPAKTAKGGNN